MSACLYSCLSCHACKAHLFYATLYYQVQSVWLSTLSHKRRDIRKLEHKMGVLNSSTTLVRKKCSIMKRIQPYITVNVRSSSCTVPVILLRF